MLSFNGSNEINKITSMYYKIKLNPGDESESIEGEYILSGPGQNNSFSMDSTNKSIHKLLIDFSDNENFTLQEGKSYLINTRYYVNGVEVENEFGLFDADLNL